MATTFIDAVADTAVAGSSYASIVATGTWVSPVVDGGKDVVYWNTLEWTETTDPATDITFEARTGATPSPDATWSVWSGPILNSGDKLPVPGSRYIQIKAYLMHDTTSGAVVLHDVTINGSYAGAEY